MALTKEEAVWVADVAMSYPAGHGRTWGWGPLETGQLDHIMMALSDRPKRIKYG